MANAATATYPGRTILWSRVRGLGTEPKNIKWGTIPTTPLVTGSANSNVALFTPATEAGVAGTSNQLQSANGFLTDTYYVTGTLTCLVGAKTITEAGLFDSVTLPATGVINAISSQAAGGTTISLVAATSFPGSGNYYIQVENETELVTAGQGTLVLTTTRAQLGSTSVAHGVGAAVTVGGDGGASSVSGGTIGGQTAPGAALFGGSMFAHADFSGIALNTNDSILFSWFDTLT